MDAINEERGSDWSHQVLASSQDPLLGGRGLGMRLIKDFKANQGQLDGCSVTRPFLYLQRVWLARLVDYMLA